MKAHAATTHDTVAGCKVFDKAGVKYPSIKGVCADAGSRKMFEELFKTLKKTLEISARITSGGKF
ncbi:hypothetical protein HE1_00872 [Holospora elegans E1]|uniref:Uncharacterized protein n=1 Tax=Holospora elegans E1 TaxID=1427503 RepID=A0A023E0I1_9PROT|nr:hypothetical protein HE1_00872 [Holospora elegans E1]